MEREGWRRKEGRMREGEEERERGGERNRSTKYTVVIFLLQFGSGPLL